MSQGSDAGGVEQLKSDLLAKEDEAFVLNNKTSDALDTLRKVEWECFCLNSNEKEIQCCPYCGGELPQHDSICKIDAVLKGLFWA